MKALKIICLFAVLAGLCRAQPALTSSALSNMAAAMQAKESAFENSIALFASHDYTAAEAALETANLHAAATPEWHAESGYSLVRLALLFHHQGDTATSSAIIQLALNHLNTADQGFTSANSAAEIATEKEATGYVYENLLGQPNVAVQWYQAAVRLSPNTGLAARYLARIQASQAWAEAKAAAMSGSH
jgi:tetratricopeptide (TPR) repeat protein